MPDAGTLLGLYLAACLVVFAAMSAASGVTAAWHRQELLRRGLARWRCCPATGRRRLEYWCRYRRRWRPWHEPRG